jgi:hypothetical protein
MTAYRVTYYNLSDGINQMIIAASNREEAGEIARQRDECFAQLKQIEYIGDKNPMTTTPTPQADRITADELRRAFDQINARLDALTDTVVTITAGIQHAATATPPTAGTFSEMEITGIIMTYDDKGKPAWKAVGTPYNKFGVRVWDEVLPALGIDPASLHPGPNTINPMRARVLMKINEEGKPAPQKVTGKA